MIKSILVVGSVNMDVVSRVERHPKLGETVRGNDLHFIPGGKGSNQALAAARLYDKVFLVGKLGTDAFGDTLHRFLQNEPVDLSYLTFSDEYPTGTALINVDAHGENTIVIIPGSNAQLNVSDIEYIDFSAVGVVVAQLETPTLTTQAAFQKAYASGAKTILNPAPAGPLSPDLLHYTSILVVNETELAFFSPDTNASLHDQAIALRAFPQQIIVITLGKNGAVCLTPENWIEVPGFVVDVVDTTGAGDCFVGALAVSIVENMDLHSGTRFANAAAALSVQTLGASTSLPRRKSVDTFLDKLLNEDIS